MADGEEAPPAPECKCEAGAPKWVVTFGDMMSLLLCFFVLLLSFSSTDVVKYKEMSGSMSEAFGVVKESEHDTGIPQGQSIVATQVHLTVQARALVATRAKAKHLVNSQSELELESGADWVRIKVPGDALFGSGEFELLPEATAVLSPIGDMINQFEGVVMVEGHTDDEPPRLTRFDSGSYLGNYELASLRAIKVLEFMVAVKGVDRRKLVPVTYGDTKPRETNDIVQGKQRNRRVEFEFQASAKADISTAEGGEVIQPGQ